VLIYNSFGLPRYMPESTANNAKDPDHTSGHLLDGRVHYAQPRKGFRSGIEPVLLAASIPVRPDESVLEGGAGAGATLLCLAARIPGLRATGIERDAGLVSLAWRNAVANLRSGLSFIEADMAALPETGTFDHACANPPYHLAAGTPSPDPARDTAKRGGTGVLHVWAATLATHLRRHGTLTFILPATLLPACAEAFAAAGCPATAMLPLWKTAGCPAKLVLVRGVKAGRTPFRVLPGLVLHDASGGFTREAEAILRHGCALAL
jgi:tRNA1Val (adenine37-N6)-methyltransferase